MQLISFIIFVLLVSVACDTDPAAHVDQTWNNILAFYASPTQWM